MSSETGLVSIIVPVYNAERYIERCAESLIGQDYPQVEIIFINDGAQDRSRALLENYQHLPQVRILDTPNRGVSAARNEGLRHASGQFILFVDADDFLSPDAVSRLRAAQQHSGADIVVGGFEKFDPDKIYDDGLIFPEDRLLGIPELVAYVRQYLNKPNRNSLFVYSWGRLFKAEIFRNHALFFNETLHTYEDVLLNHQALLHIDSLYYLSQRLYHYRIHPGYVSATTLMVGSPERMFGYPHALEAARAFLEKHLPDSGETTRAVAHAHVVYTIIQLVRLCGNLSRFTARPIYAFVFQLVRKPWLVESLPHYRPTGQDSRTVPRLLKRKLVMLTILTCFIKGRKRYGWPGWRFFSFKRV